MKTPTLTATEKRRADRELRRMLARAVTECRRRADTTLAVGEISNAGWAYLATRIEALRRTVKP